MMTKVEFIKQVTEKIKSLREASDLSQFNFAKKAGLARTTITNLEGGGYEPAFYTAYCIANAFDITLDELVKEKKR